MTAPVMDTTSIVPNSDDVPSDMFERVIRALNVAYFEWSDGNDKVRVSAALAELFGLDPGTFTVQRQLEQMHPDDVPGYRATMKAYLKSGADRAEFSFRARNASGEYRSVRLHNLAERDVSGRVTRLTGTVSDITELKQREAQNRDLIARQAASIEVLKTISASPDDAQPVFDLIARRARELCDARAVTVTEYDGTLSHLRAIEGYEPEVAVRFRQEYPRTPGSDTMSGRTVLSGQIGHIRDASTDADFFQLGRDLGSRSLLGMPLLRGGRVIGAIVLLRFDTGGSTTPRSLWCSPLPNRR